MVLSGLGSLSSMTLEVLSGKHVMTIEGTELTVTPTGRDDLLLAVFAFTSLLTLALWAHLRRRR